MLLNGMVLNLDKVSIIRFIMNHSLQCELSTGYRDKYVEEMVHEIFALLGCYTE
jgi:hypothetical protein